MVKPNTLVQIYGVEDKGRTQLILYDKMCSAISACYKVDEVKDIRDKAMALEAYARQARDMESERQACEIRLRAERKAGELLSTMEKAKRGVGRKNLQLHDETANSEGAKTLEDLGISKTQSHRWQKLAEIPDDEFEARLAAKEKPTTSGFVDKKKPPQQERMDPAALWLWGQLREFEREGILDRDQKELIDELTPEMLADIKRILPSIIEWLEELI